MNKRWYHRLYSVSDNKPNVNAVDLSRVENDKCGVMREHPYETTELRISTQNVHEATDIKKPSLIVELESKLLLLLPVSSDESARHDTTIMRSKTVDINIAAATCSEDSVSLGWAGSVIGQLALCIGNSNDSHPTIAGPRVDPGRQAAQPDDWPVYKRRRARHSHTHRGPPSKGRSSRLPPNECENCTAAAILYIYQLYRILRRDKSFARARPAQFSGSSRCAACAVLLLLLLLLLSADDAQFFSFIHHINSTRRCSMLERGAAERGHKFLREESARSTERV
ncbi:unnamed protein product [Trichogramma brassicae]|uniref:Uncharacterized protein n=1 Tax=Trichogramma brassicae TaxID=86971 RepID=A0A6H5IAV9_9HYME|nr:unnamed protein product [Trichogramma brassicae]